MNESFEQPQYRRLGDKSLPDPVFGEIRVDGDGNSWEWTRAHHKKSEEVGLKSAPPPAFWSKYLQIISDDAEAEARGVYDESDNVAREQSDDDEVVGRWQAVG